MSSEPKTPNGGGNGESENGESEFKVKDRRHWVDENDDEGGDDTEPAAPATPTIIDEYRLRTEAAEQKLQEYIEAFKSFKQEQEDFRTRLNRDVERRVELKFGGLVEELLGSGGQPGSGG